MGILLSEQHNLCMTTEPYVLPKVLPLPSNIYILEVWMSARVYTVLYIRLVWGGEKCCGSGVMKDKSHFINGKNGSLEARKESGSSINTQSRGMVEQRPRTDGFLLNPSNIQP